MVKRSAHTDRLNTLLKAGRRRREILSCGVTVLSEVITTRQAVNFGVWVANGSQGDSAAESGLSHFLEHLVFKGSPRYKQKDISH
jgi:predicted Zn-dependent peptidase